MNKPNLKQNKPKNTWHQFHQQVSSKAQRKITGRKSQKSIWFVLGMFGMVGWSITLPTLIGIALGVWIDNHIKTPYSWTLILLVIGLFLGCITAWYWIEKESKINTKTNPLKKNNQEFPPD
jgi:ATP synthase protein I